MMKKGLGPRKKLARWVPHELSQRQRQACMDHAQSFLAQWGHQWSRLVTKLVTVDETGVSYNTLHTRVHLNGERPALRHQNCPVCPAIGASPWQSFSGIAEVLCTYKEHYLMVHREPTP